MEESKTRQAVSDEISASLLVFETAAEQLRANLHDNAQLTGVELAALMEPDLDVARICGSCPGFLRAVDGFGDEVRQAFGETTQVVATDRAVVDDVNQGHHDILARRADREPLALAPGLALTANASPVIQPFDTPACGEAPLGHPVLYRARYRTV